MSKISNVSLSQISITESFIGLYFGTLAGLAGSPGSTNGTGSAARFYTPDGVAADSAGNVFVVDHDSNTIRKVTSAGVVTTLAGTAGVTGSTDATGSAARFYAPNKIGVDAAGNVYVITDYCVRKISPSGNVTTLAGLAGYSSYSDANGATARFGNPWSICVDADGNVFVTER